MSEIRKKIRKQIDFSKVSALDLSILAERNPLDKQNLPEFQPTVYDFFLKALLNNNEEKKHYPLADVLRHPKQFQSNPNKHSQELFEIANIAKILETYGFSNGQQILTHFLEQSEELTLEEHLTPKSIIYIFSGFITYLNHFREETKIPLIAKGKEIGPELIKKVSLYTNNHFQGWRNLSTGEKRRYFRIE